MNNNLEPDKLNFSKKVAYPLILEKKASLFIRYDGEKRIVIILNFMSNNIIFGTMSVFDIAYAKYNVGSVNIMKLIEWCLNNHIKFLDFSKGYFVDKVRWTNVPYYFEYYILKDRSSFNAKCIALILIKYFRPKQYLTYKVETLKRIRIMNIKLDIPVGEYRELTKVEFNKLIEDTTKTYKANTIRKSRP